MSVDKPESASVTVLSRRAVERVAASRPDGYVADVLAVSVAVGADSLLMPAAEYERLKRKYAARRGLGDLVAAGLGAVGITEARVSRLLGRRCKCRQRADALNRLGQRALDAVRSLTAKRG